MIPAEEPAARRWTMLARLIRPQGRRGEMLAEILTDFPERFGDRKRLVLLGAETDDEPRRAVWLESFWLHKGRVVLKFAAVDSISDAERLRGLLVAIPAAERVRLEDGAVYISDLIGCEVVDANADYASIGSVVDFDREAGLLVVGRGAGDPALIPFARAYLAQVDLAARKIIMRLPEGLLAINAPVTDEERREMNRPNTPDTGDTCSGDKD